MTCCVAVGCAAPASRKQLHASTRIMRYLQNSPSAGETACATLASPMFPKVGQAVSPASAACGRILQVPLKSVTQERHRLKPVLRGLTWLLLTACMLFGQSKTDDRIASYSKAVAAQPGSAHLQSL